MKLVPPESILANRVYLTEFDRVTYSQVAWTQDDTDAIRRNMERKFKLIALIKGHIVIAASHLLESELAHSILFDHPRLFAEGIVVPALRSEFRSCEEYLDSKLAEGEKGETYSSVESRDMAQMLDSQANMAVQWNVHQTSGWFKQRLLLDLGDEHSLLRSCIRNAGLMIEPDLAEHIADIPTLSRGDVYLMAQKTLSMPLREMLCNYVDFVYYLSGARAVKSEGILPQENLMDFSLSEMAGGHTCLSESEIFFKMFIDLVKSVTQKHFPVDVLDALTMEDVMDLHSIAVEERFVYKYNAIQEKTINGLTIRDPERLVLLMDELEQFERELHGEYMSAIEQELPRYLRNIKMSGVAKLINAIASLLIPGWGTAESTRGIIVSALDLGGKQHIRRTAEKRVKGAIKAYRMFSEKETSDRSPILLEFVRKIQKRYGESMLES